MIPLTVECSKLGWIGLRLGFGLSGVTPGHFQGRIEFVKMINPAKGLRLRGMFDQIQW